MNSELLIQEVFIMLYLRFQANLERSHLNRGFMTVQTAVGSQESVALSQKLDILFQVQILILRGTTHLLLFIPLLLILWEKSIFQLAPKTPEL